MRTIFLLRGVPGSGKSTWIKENNLEQYTLSADNIRLMYQSPVLNIDGNFGISQQNDNEVWDLLMNLLETRMSRGEFVIVDATHYKSALINKYKDLISEYRYRAYVVDFTNIPLEEVLKRNKGRDTYKQVPEEVIEKMYEVFKGDKEVSNRFTVVTPNTALDMLKIQEPYDYNNYNKVVVFGDIHGCFSPLQKYFEENPFSIKTAYIFVGDYIDRGIQNKEVLEFLLSIKDNKNVLLLEGNHESHLRIYAEGKDFSVTHEEKTVLSKYLSKSQVYKILNKKIHSSVFLKKTIPQIKEISLNKLKQLCRKFGQMAYITFNNKSYYVTHGGVPILPSLAVSTSDMIQGVGKYIDIENLYNSWLKNTKNCVLIHGHRNIFNIDTKVNDRVYNLNSDIELGGDLRILEISKDGEKVVLVPNDTWDKNLEAPNRVVTNLPNSDNEIINNLNKSKDIRKKVLPDGIVSYNFTNDVFYDKRWNEITCTARGLFIDTEANKIVSRSYNKFFNIEEVPETRLRNLYKTVCFPLKAYKKENGFLGIVSYNEKKDDLLICSKSTSTGPFAKMARDLILKLNKNAILDIVKNGKSLVFEIIDIGNDPHIIKYNESHVVLLECIDNTFEYKNASYNELEEMAIKINCPVKQLEYTFNNWDEFYSFYQRIEKDTNLEIEGWVFEDTNNFHFKYKTRYYKFWKAMRHMKDTMCKSVKTITTFKDLQEVKIYNYMKTIPTDKLEEMSIIDIREKMENEHK